MKELALKVLLTAHLSIYLYICQYKQKGVQLGGFGGQFTCSWAGVDPEIIVWGEEGGSSRPLLTFYRVFQLTIPREQTFPRSEGESKFLGAVGVGVGVGCGGPNTYS